MAPHQPARRTVTGFVLTGGLSTRMGRDKALLPFSGHTLCEHIGDVLSQVAGKVLLVGHPERYSHLKYQCLADLQPGFGPLSGLETALSFGSELNLVASCDIANIKLDWLRLLIEATEYGARCAVLEDAAGQLQPLCGVYTKECLPSVAEALRAKRPRMMDLLKQLGAQPVRVSDAVANFNTPADFLR